MKLRNTISYNGPSEFSTSSAQLDQRIIEDQLYSILSECSSDAVVLVNQPGLQASDFVYTDMTAPLWHHFTRYFKRSGTFLPYLQTSSPLDLAQTSRFFIAQCNAEEVTANVNSPESPLQKYIDTRKRVIRVNFEPVPPDDSPGNAELRQFKLVNHDIMLAKIIDTIPSPFITIIYTSTSRGEISTESTGRYSKYPWIHELLKFTKDPINRDKWKSQFPEGVENIDRSIYRKDPREETFLKRRLPLAQEKHEQERTRKLDDMKRRKIHDKNTVQERLDALLSPEAIVSAGGVALLLAALYKLLSFVRWIFVGLLGDSRKPEDSPQAGSNEQTESKHSNASSTGVELRQKSSDEQASKEKKQS